MDKRELYDVIAGIDGDLVDSAIEAEKQYNRRKKTVRTVTLVALFSLVTATILAGAFAALKIGDVYAKRGYTTETVQCTPGPDGKADVIVIEHYEPVDFDDPATWSEYSEQYLIYNKGQTVLSANDIDIFVCLSTYDTSWYIYSFSSVHHSLNFVQKDHLYDISLATDDDAVYREVDMAKGRLQRFNIGRDEKQFVFSVSRNGKVLGHITVTLENGEGYSGKTFLKIRTIESDFGLKTAKTDFDQIETLFID